MQKWARTTLTICAMSGSHIIGLLWIGQWRTFVAQLIHSTSRVSFETAETLILKLTNKSNKDLRVACFRPDLNWRPSACKADVITTTLRKPLCRLTWIFSSCLLARTPIDSSPYFCNPQFYTITVPAWHFLHIFLFQLGEGQFPTLIKV